MSEYQVSYGSRHRQYAQEQHSKLLAFREKQKEAKQMKALNDELARKFDELFGSFDAFDDDD